MPPLQSRSSRQLMQNGCRSLGHTTDGKKKGDIIMENNKSNENKNEMNAILLLPDFAKFNSINFHKCSVEGILGVNKSHFLIYLITLALSILLTIPYGCDSVAPLYSILMSVGASGVGAAILGYFIAIKIKKALLI